MRLRVGDSEAFIYRGGTGPGADMPAVLFIHGAGHDHSVWNLPARYWAHHGHAVLAPDLPGHGASAGRPLPSIEAAAQWIVDLLDAAGVPTAKLVGHSMGSLVALATAARAPERVAALALVGTSVPMPVAAPLLDAARDDRARAHQMINQWSFSARAQLGAGALPGFSPTVLNLRLMERQAEGVLHADLAACNAYAGGLEAAARVCCPTLLVCGARDQMTPARNLAPLREALAKVPGGVRVHTIADCGHAIMAEAPDPLTSALGALLMNH